MVLMLAGGSIGFLEGAKNQRISRKLLTGLLLGLVLTASAGAILLHNGSLFMAVAAGFLLGQFIGADLRKTRERKSAAPQFRFCPNCRATLHERDIDGKRRMACPICQFVHWNNPIPVASVLVPSADGKGVCLIKRSIPPKVGDYALPGGFLEPGEDPAEGGKREVKEETGLDVEIVRLLSMVAIPRANQILIFYLAKPTSQTPTTSNETSEVAFYPWDQLPANIAFPIHKSVIDGWIAETITAAK
jgi:ADP-ribose pyrophosphatase YjhB (NUDIX family)